MHSGYGNTKNGDDINYCRGSEDADNSFNL